MFRSILLGASALTMRALVVSGTLAAFAIAGYSNAFAQDAGEDGAPVEDRVLATVDGQPIYQSQLRSVLSPNYHRSISKIFSKFCQLWWTA